MSEADLPWRKEGWRDNGGHVLLGHLVLLLQVDHSAEEPEQLPERVTVFVWQQLTQHGQRLVLIMRR